MSQADMVAEICKVFALPMGLKTSDLEEGKQFSFKFLQRTGAGSRTLCAPSVASSFEV